MEQRTTENTRNRWRWIMDGSEEQLVEKSDEQLEARVKGIQAKDAAASASILRFIKTEVREGQRGGLIRALRVVHHEEAQRMSKDDPQLSPARIELGLAWGAACQIICDSGGKWDFDNDEPINPLKPIPFEAIQIIAENEAINYVKHNDPSYRPVQVHTVYEWLISEGYATRDDLIHYAAILEALKKRPNRRSIRAPNSGAAALAAPPETTLALHTTMSGRLGQVLSWTANIIAVGVIGVFGVAALSFGSGNEKFMLALAGVVIAAIVWACGRGLRYILAGT